MIPLAAMSLAIWLQQHQRWVWIVKASSGRLQQSLELWEPAGATWQIAVSGGGVAGGEGEAH